MGLAHGALISHRENCYLRSRANYVEFGWEPWEGLHGTAQTTHDASRRQSTETAPASSQALHLLLLCKADNMLWCPPDSLGHEPASTALE